MTFEEQHVSMICNFCLIAFSPFISICNSLHNLQIVYNMMLENGVTFIDTSESYGRSLTKKSLSAEHIIGKSYEENSEVDPLISTSLANPWMHLLDGGGLRFGRRGIVQALEDSCDRLGAGVEVLEVPAALYLGFPNALPDGLSQCSPRAVPRPVQGLPRAAVPGSRSRAVFDSRPMRLGKSTTFNASSKDSRAKRPSSRGSGGVAPQYSGSQGANPPNSSRAQR